MRVINNLKVLVLVLFIASVSFSAHAQMTAGNLRDYCKVEKRLDATHAQDSAFTQLESMQVGICDGYILAFVHLTPGYSYVDKGNLITAEISDSSIQELQDAFIGYIDNHPDLEKLQPAEALVVVAIKRGMLKFTEKPLGNLAPAINRITPTEQ